jgi:hypothetical protein
MKPILNNVSDFRVLTCPVISGVVLAAAINVFTYVLRQQSYQWKAGLKAGFLQLAQKFIGEGVTRGESHDTHTVYQRNL